jgi:hypothetical protein
MVYDELPSDSVGIRLGGSVLNAIIVVCGITIMTFMFVLCFKYHLYKVSIILRRGSVYTSIQLEMHSFYSFGWVYPFCQFLV